MVLPMRQFRRKETACMLARGDHQIETYPGLGRRMMVAACLALGLMLVGLLVSAHAATLGTVTGAVSQSAF